MTVSEARRRLAAPTVGDASWAALIVFYLLLRLPGVTQIPIAGIELHDLTRAWLAHAGDARGSFQPTFAQGVALLSFEWTESESFARWITYAVGTSVPFGIYALRERLGDVGAAVTLIFLALSAPALYLSSTATAVAFDLPIVVWALVWMDRAHGPRVLWAIGGLLLAGSGPIVGVFALAVGLIFLATGGTVRRDRLVLAALGIALGLGYASLANGSVGLAVPTLQHFVDGYSTDLEAGSAGLLLPMYMFPVLAASIGGAALLVVRWLQSGRRPSRWWLSMLAWWALAVLWLASSLTSGSPVPIAAVVLPSALLAGFALDAWARRVEEFDWRRSLLPFVGAAAGLTATGVVLSGWARRGESGDVWESVVLVLALMGTFAALSVVAVGQRTLGTLVGAAALPAAMLLLIGVVPMAFGGASEPIFSPQSERSGRILRDVAEDSAAEIGGSIIVHASLEDDVAWSFRGLPSYGLSTGIPLDAAVVVLPAGSLAPDGFQALANEFRLATTIEPPSSLLQFVRWTTARNTVESSGLNVSVYLRTVE